VILEAMAFGVPTLAFASDGENFQTASDEIIEHEVDGVLAADEGDFGQKLKRLIESPQRLLTLGETGREKVIASHTWSGAGRKWQVLLDELVGAAGPEKPKELLHV